MDDKDIAKLATKLTTYLATKEDIKNLATKEDFQGLKFDVKVIQSDVQGLKGDIKRLEKKVNEIDQNTRTLLKYAGEIEGVTDQHENRLRAIESIPAIAHEIKNKPKH